MPAVFFAIDDVQTTGDVDPPEITNCSPTGTGVSTTAAIRCDITDELSGVDLENTTIEVDGETVYDWDGTGDPEDGFQEGWQTGSSIVAVAGGYRITTQIEGHFGSEATVTVLVATQDTEGNATTYEWSFTMLAIAKPVAVIVYNDIRAFLGNTIQLDGRQSFDQEGRPLTFKWRFKVD